MNHRPPIANILRAAVLVGLAVGGTKVATAVDFGDEIAPILEAHCTDCHGADKQKSGLRLDSMVAALRGGESGEKAVVPGKSGSSYLIELVASDDPDHRMPPKGEPLAAAQVAKLKAWIDDRPSWEPAIAEASRLTTDHWSFQPVKRPPVPKSEFENPIDAFVAAKLSENGLIFNPPADARDLVRRMHLDVTGLLPEAGKDDLPLITDGDARRLADELLASPHYGERWARHWLDVVRFAESAGFETNHERPNAYHYRDYVIRALNSGKPYDRFVFEQIAGDTVGEDAATGFIVGGAYDRVKGQDKLLNKMQRQDELSDMVGTTGTAFLGLTVGCAKCHNHKFDPVTQTDFFAMQSVFAGVQHGEREMRGADHPERKAKADALAKKIASLRSQLAAFQPEPFHGVTVFLDDTEGSRTEVLTEKRGDGKNPPGPGRGHLGDPGGAGHLPNLSGGTYAWWTNQPGADVFVYRPKAQGKFRLWLSWGCGWKTHTQDALYLLDRDGDPTTKDDQTEIATVDQQRFADGSGDVPGRPLWSGFFDAGVHDLAAENAIVLRCGKTGTAITADAIVLQSPGSNGAQPRLRPPVNAAANEEIFAPTTVKVVRFTVEKTNNGIEPCIDELEIWTAGTESKNVALGGKPASSGNYTGNPKHKLEHINDGQYGNGRSWISNEGGKGWVQIELDAPAEISRIQWQRDRDKVYADRLPTGYRIEVAESADGPWKTVASSDIRAPFGTSATDQVAWDLAGLAPEAAERARAIWSQIAPLETERAALMKAEMAYAGRFVQPPGPTRRLFRGDPLAPKEVVAPDGVAILAETLGGFDLAPDGPEKERRVALANWIIHPDNPLTARVIVNRLWHYHFGKGIVATPSDFGAMGFGPTHPELLDWLASELVENGWSLKHIHRLILTSRTYRQSSAPRKDGLAKDAGSRWLWRFPPRRLEAEAIRDNILLVAGKLDRKMFGPGFLLFVPNSNYARNWIPKDTFGEADMRRMIYALKLRMEHDAIFGAFDCPDAGSVTPARSRSTTPIQALNLFNSGFILEQAKAFAQRAREFTDGKGKVDSVFQIAFGRDPTPEEAAAAARLVEKHGLEALCRAIFNANEFLFLQ